MAPQKSEMIKYDERKTAYRMYELSDKIDMKRLQVVTYDEECKR